MTRVTPNDALFGAEALESQTGITGSGLLDAISHLYRTLDGIDSQLHEVGVSAFSQLVELANLSSVIGNVLGAALAANSRGLYKRNAPHTFPDLVPQTPDLPDLELKVALETNSPKGHLPKAGTHFIIRYCLGDPAGSYVRGKKNRGPTAWIWEIRCGHVAQEDFKLSNTPGDSGKTAVIPPPVLKQIPVIYFDRRFFPYAGPWGGLGI